MNPVTIHLSLYGAAACRIGQGARALSGSAIRSTDATRVTCPDCLAVATSITGR